MSNQELKFSSTVFLLKSIVLHENLFPYPHLNPALAPAQNPTLKGLGLGTGSGASAGLR